MKRTEFFTSVFKEKQFSLVFMPFYVFYYIQRYFQGFLVFLQKVLEFLTGSFYILICFVMKHTLLCKVSTYLSGTFRSHFFEIQLLLAIIYIAAWIVGFERWCSTPPMQYTTDAVHHWCSTTLSHKQGFWGKHDWAKGTFSSAFYLFIKYFNSFFWKKWINRSMWVPKEFWNVMKVVPCVITILSFSSLPHNM